MNTQERFSQARNTFNSSSRSRGFFDDLFGGGDIGDSPSSAKNIGKLKRGSSYEKSGDVGGSDLDFYKFRVERNANFSARLRSDSDNDDAIAITILDRNGNAVSSNGRFLFRNVNPGQSSRISISRLAKGDYFVRLESENGRNEDYDFELTRSRSNSSGDNFDDFDDFDDFDGSDGFGGGSGSFDDDGFDSGFGFDNGFGFSNDSQTIGTLRSGRRYSYSGAVGGSDVDFYRFDVDDISRFTASLDNRSNDPIAVSILDSSNNVVQTANGRFLFGNVEADSSATLFAPTLESGSYTVRVQSEVGSRENYRLALQRSDSLFI